MPITRDDAVGIATDFVAERGWREHWSRKRLSVRQVEHPDLQVLCWCVETAPVALGVPVTTVWLDADSGRPLSAERVGGRAWPEAWRKPNKKAERAC